MTTFEERREAYESKVSRDQELRFKALARRNRLIGLWAAEKLGKSGDDAQAYARGLVRTDMREVGDEDVFGNIRADFDKAGVAQSDHQIRRTMEELMVEAVAQIEAGT